MLIDFKKLPLQALAAFKGGDGEYLVRTSDDGRVKIMLGRLQPGCSIGIHTHEGNSETIYMLSGKGEVFYDGTSFELLPGQAHYCAEGHTHGLRCNAAAAEDAVFFAIVPQTAQN